ncbi:MAG: thiol-activated cytolysin family protein [Candidatus Krumholzibacteriota bacterium]
MNTQIARPEKKFSLRVTLTFMFLLMFAFAGCGSDDNPLDPGGGNNNGEFTEVLNSGGDFEQPVPKNEVVEERSEPEPGPDGTFWVCSEKTYDFVGAPPEYAGFNANHNIVYPGNLLQGATLSSATPEPIIVRRAGGSISIDLLNGSSGVSARVDEMSRSKVRQAANDILAANTGVIPARFNVDTYKVQSREQMAASLGVNVSTLTTDFNARMSFESDTRYNRVVVVLNQTFYQMDYDDPVSDADVFAPEVTPEDLEPFVGPGNPAAYIASVTYGRRFYILVESTQTETEIEAAIQASYNAAAAGGSIEAEATYVKDLSEVKVKVHAMGGDQALALNTFNGDFGAVREFLTQGADYLTGVPLVYSLRALKDKRSIAVKVATRYTVKECVPIEDSIENPIVWFDGNHGMDFIYGTTESRVPFVKRWTSKFPSAIPATPTNADVCGFWGDTYISDTEGAVYFGKGNSTAGTESGQLKYDGRGFEGTDYTIFVVYRPSGGSGIRHLAWGASDTPNEYLALGYDADAQEIFMSHGPNQTLRAPSGGPYNWFLYTFRFSQTEGMSIYENDRLIGEDRTLTSPVRFYPEAQIGSADATFTPQESSVIMGQFKAYGSAVSEGQRRAQIITWINRFNL